MRSIEWLGESVRFIDQTKLPLEERYIETTDYHVIAEAIQTLRLRGAPLIGISAAYGIALASLQSKKNDIASFRKEIQSVIQELSSTRPTAVNLQWATGRMILVLDAGTNIPNLRIDLVKEAVEIHRDDAERCERIGENGARLIPPDSIILTHCNTGALATGGDGTALNVIKKGYKLGNVRHVFIDETRPLLQGARLTTWELLKENIPSTLITDNMAASLMKGKKVNAIITGADRIAANGDTANKIGTYSLAVLAHYHKIPFYVAAPWSTIDAAIADGSHIPIEQRSPQEIMDGFGKRIAPEGTKVYNPAFDVTPAELITAIITDKEVYRPPYNFSNE